MSTEGCLTEEEEIIEHKKGWRGTTVVPCKECHEHPCTCYDEEEVLSDQ